MDSVAASISEKLNKWINSKKIKHGKYKIYISTMTKT